MPIVRVLFSRDRATEAEKELVNLAGRKCYRQGTDPSKLFDFATREQADLFAVGAQNTPGVVAIKIDGH